MPRQKILCKDCAKKKREIENNGALKVVSCELIEGEDSKSEDKRRCLITWTYR